MSTLTFLKGLADDLNNKVIGDGQFIYIKGNDSNTSRLYFDNGYERIPLTIVLNDLGITITAD